MTSVPFESGAKFEPRYYQLNAINSVIKAMAQNKKRILLTLATGTGKTCIAFQIVWKLFNAKWNTKEIGASLGISEKTVRNHISNAMQKLGVKGRAQAVVELIRLGSITL